MFPSGLHLTRGEVRSQTPTTFHGLRGWEAHPHRLLAGSPPSPWPWRDGVGAGRSSSPCEQGEGTYVPSSGGLIETAARYVRPSGRCISIIVDVLELGGRTREAR